MGISPVAGGWPRGFRGRLYEDPRVRAHERPSTTTQTKWAARLERRFGPLRSSCGESQLGCLDGGTANAMQVLRLQPSPPKGRAGPSKNLPSCRHIDFA